MTTEELNELGKAISQTIEPLMNAKGYTLMGDAVTNLQYTAKFQKDRFDVLEKPLFVTVRQK